MSRPKWYHNVTAAIRHFPEMAERGKDNEAHYYRADVPPLAEARAQGISCEKWEELCRNAGV